MSVWREFYWHFMEISGWRIVSAIGASLMTMVYAFVWFWRRT